MSVYRTIGFYCEDGRFSGPQRFILNLAEKLKDDGYPVVILIPRLESGHVQSTLMDKSLPYRLINLTRPSKRPMLLMKYCCFFFNEIETVVSIIKKEKIKILYVVGGIWQYKGIIAAILAGSKVMWRFNDVSVSPLFRYIHAIFARHIDLHIFNGYSVYNYYKDLIMFGKYEIIQSPVDTNYFVNINPNYTRKNLNITLISNLNPLKGVEYFVKMAAILGRRYPSLSFYVAGQPLSSQKKYIRYIHHVAEKENADIKFLGYVKDIKGLLEKTDIYVCASITEASPNSVWEAMAMSVPVVATDVGDIGRIAVDGEDILIVEPGNVAEMVIKVERLILDANLRKKIGLNGRKKVETVLDIEMIKDVHLRMLENIDESVSHNGCL